MSEDLLQLAASVLPAIAQIEAGLSAVVDPMIPHAHACGVIQCTKENWDAATDAFGRRDAFFAAMMPTEQDAITLMHAAYTRLKGLGWSEAMYCPKDGTTFDAIEAGSTGIHATHYSGEWPNGHWWIEDAGDLWPSHPILYRRTEAEKQRFAMAAAAFDVEHANPEP